MFHYDVNNIQYPLLIDGGLSNALVKQGCDLNDKLWSAKILETNPEAIIQAHYDYLIAGAKCITSASYQATIPGFMAVGYSLTEAKALIIKSTELAEIAISRFKGLDPDGKKPLIAASIGPYGAFLADGSEYHGSYNISDEKLREFHLDRIRLLDQTNADVFACETIPSFQEARVLGNILAQTNKSAWLSFSCKDDRHINDGTRIEECVSYLADHPKIFALGVNCTAPKYISGLIKSIKVKSGTKKIVVYPNSGEVLNAKNKAWYGVSDLNPFFRQGHE